MIQELISAEIMLHPVHGSPTDADLNHQILEVEEQLKEYTLTLTSVDYAAAVICGILSGGIDALWIGETPFQQSAQKAFSGQLKEITQTVLKRVMESKPLPSLTPSFQKAVAPGALGDIPFLSDLAQRISPTGLGAAILLQLSAGGLLSFSKDNIRLFPADLDNQVSESEKAVLVLAAIVIGVMKWLQTASTEDHDREDFPVRFSTLDKVRDLVRSSAGFGKFLTLIERWQKQLPNEFIKAKTANSEKNAAKPAYGKESIFLTFFTMLGSAPGLEHTGLAAAMRLQMESKRIGLNKIPVVNSLTKQTVPVLLNETLVRTFFFATRLAKELAITEDVNAITWDHVLPFNNRNVDRMMVFSSTTLSLADTTDALIHAALDSEGNAVLFGARFVSRFNLVAAGRAVVAVCLDVAEDHAEMELLIQKRRLTEERAARVRALLSDYRKKLNAKLAEFITADLETFLQGVDLIDKGLAAKDSDLILQGNVIIQRKLGKEAQFSSQKEFDALMDSDIPLNL